MSPFADLRVAVGRGGAISVTVVSSKSAELIYEASELAPA
jgi:hypothetical protein